MIPFSAPTFNAPAAAAFQRKIKPKPDYPLKTLYPREFQTGLDRLIYYDFTTVE